jgi:hypothetical protein
VHSSAGRYRVPCLLKTYAYPHTCTCMRCTPTHSCTHVCKADTEQTTQVYTGGTLVRSHQGPPDTASQATWVHLGPCLQEY